MSSPVLGSGEDGRPQVGLGSKAQWDPPSRPGLAESHEAWMHVIRLWFVMEVRKREGGWRLEIASHRYHIRFLEGNMGVTDC
jgi:hypothetical protein